MFGAQYYFGIIENLYCAQKVVVWRGTRISNFVQSHAPQLVQSHEQF